MRRIVLLGLLLLSPVLVRADALDAVPYVFGGLAAAGGVVLLSVMLTVWAYFRPASRALQVLNLILVVLNLLLGLLWAVVLDASSMSSRLLGFNPFLAFAVPLAVWLGAAQQAQRAATPAWRAAWTSGAVFGAHVLCGWLWQAVLRVVVPNDTLVSLYQLPFGQVVLWLMGLPVAVAVWWLVLEQVQRRQPLQLLLPANQIWLLGLPALATGWNVLYGATAVLLTAAQYMQRWDLAKYLASMLGYGVLGCGVGVLVVWLNQQRRAAT